MKVLFVSEAISNRSYCGFSWTLPPAGCGRSYLVSTGRPRPRFWRREISAAVRACHVWGITD